VPIAIIAARTIQRAASLLSDSTLMKWLALS